jgi:penicillin amidase
LRTSRLAGLPLDRLAAVLPPAAAEGIGAPAGIGSNVWVVDGSRTLSGRPLLANDPHLPLQAPGPWYLAHLEAPGLGVIGATLPALPFVVLGRNRDVAWGFTNTGSDTQDLFIERLDPDDPGRYRTPEGFRPFAVRQETIGVRGEAPVVLTVRETRHGPVVSDLVPGAADAAGAGHVLALAWTQLRDEDPTVEVGFAIATSRDAAGFAAAVTAYQGAQQNMAFADRRGRIGMASPGLVPIRRRGDGRLPQPGWSGEFDWLGTIPQDALPRRLDPAGGLLLNANNRLVGADYPYLLARDWDPDLRARRLEALLAPAKDLDVAAFAAVQLDLVSTLALDFLPQLLAVAPETPQEREILAALAAWDRRMPAERPEPLVFAAWYRALAAAIYADELGPLFSAYRGLRPDFMRHVFRDAPRWCDDIGTAAVETCRERAGLAFRTALRRLQAAYGPDWRKWRWGAAHPAVMAHRPLDESGLLHALFTITRPVGGDGSTINVALADAAGDDAFFPVVHAATYRAIYDLSSPDGEGSRYVAATGQSGHPFSPHYRDLSALWRFGNYLPMSMRPVAFARGAIGTLKLLPAAAGTRG